MSDAQREQILRRVVRLVDISRDLDRNRSDSDFSAAGGHVVRVLDENIFEMFFRPYRFIESVQTFYDELWSRDKAPDPEWRAFEAQSALLTAELLIGKAGSDRGVGPLILTEQHRFELAKRIEELADELRRIADTSRKKFRRELALKMAVASDLERGRVERAEEFARTLDKGALGRDSDDLRVVADEAVVGRFRSTRVAAAYLANDELLEPLEQLRRAVSHPIRSSLRTAQTLFPASGVDRASIEADADRWYERIVRELKSPGHQGRRRAVRQRRMESSGTPPPRGKTSEFAVEIRNDARSIAHLRWVVRNRLKPGERLVFVTGDPVVFDAYRRWYLARDPDSREGPEPFFLRRAVQYSPMFNPVESGSDLAAGAPGAGQPFLFNLIQQAVEASLLPLLQLDDTSIPDSVDPCFNAARERLALKLVDTDDLTADEELSELGDRLTDDWLSERSDEFARITDRWQEAHRLSIGASFDLVRQRSGGELRETAARYFDTTGPDASPILSQYITGVLDQLIDDSLQLWLPIADAFEAGGEGAGRKARRPKRITVALDHGLRTMPAADEPAAPEAVFAAAAVRALEHQDVSSGQRFANLAMRAHKVAKSRGDVPPGRELELQYLQAVAYRLQILSVESHLRKSRSPARRADLVQRGAETVKTLHARASNLIEHCIAEHATAMDDADEAATKSAAILLLRGLSERASLNLFTATSFGLAARFGESPLLGDWSRHLDLARGDLRRCLRLDEGLGANNAILEDVRAQFIPNIACYDVLAHVLAPRDAPPLQVWPRRDIRRVWDFWSSHTHIHPLLRAELAGYAALTGDTPPQGVPLQGRSHLDDHRALDLPLDRALYRSIHRDLPLPRIRPSRT